MDIVDIYRTQSSALNKVVKNHIFNRKLKPTEEKSTSLSGTPSGNSEQIDYMHNPLSSEYLLKKK